MRRGSSFILKLEMKNEFLRATGNNLNFMHVEVEYYLQRHIARPFYHLIDDKNEVPDILTHHLALTK